MLSCLQSSVALVFATTSSSCTSPLFAELGCGYDDRVARATFDLFVSSFSSHILREVLQSSLLCLVPGRQSGTLDSVTRILIDPSHVFWWSHLCSSVPHAAHPQARSAPWPCLKVLSELPLSLLSLHRAFPSCSLGTRRFDYLRVTHVRHRLSLSGRCTPDTVLSSSSCLLAISDAAEVLACPPRSGS